MQLRSPIPSLNQPKNKKVYSKKNSLYFRKRKFLALILKNAYIFSKKSFSYIFWKKSFSYIFSKYSFSYISGNEPLHFLTTTFKIFSPKDVLYFFLKIPGLKKFIIFSQKKAFLIFPEMEACTFQPKLGE